MPYTIDDLLDKPFDWVLIVYYEVTEQIKMKMKFDMSLHGIDPTKAFSENDTSEINQLDKKSERRILKSMGIKTLRKGK